MIGVGIIGAGHFGAVHARAMAEVSGIRLVASCRNDSAAAGKFAQTHGGTAFSDWRALLADPGVDAVVIATPHHLHEEIAIAAADAGKHILLEKPMAPTTRACDAINAAVSRAGVQLLVGHVMHFARPCLKAMEILDSGAIGRPVLGSSGMIKLWMESNRRDWHKNIASGGGMLMTAGIHALDRLVWLMGQDVVGVQAMTGTLFHQQEADDSALISLRFAGGGIGQVQSVGYRNGAPGSAMDLVCEGGSLRIDFDHGVLIGRDAVWTNVPDSMEPDWMHHAVVREWRALREAITGAAPVAVSGAYARQIVGIIEAAYRSSAERREIGIGGP
ncbi:MAG: Gfo/Idh/MocA family oxidoreductase [Paracoccus sp. (in: a-proteobacteria)]|nr:Gfo/Idh/MocA family oxidoreductase [Paracoccus sp. (in: a-proteobacteria)]